MNLDQFAKEYLMRRKFRDEKCHKCGGGPTERDIDNGGMDRIRTNAGKKGQKWSKPIYTCSDCLLGTDLESDEMNQYEKERIIFHTQSSSGGWV
jgi:hypothetical protein